MWLEAIWPWWHVTWGHSSSTFFWGQCELLTQKKFLPWAPSHGEVDMWFYHSCKLKTVWPSQELKKVQFAAAKARGGQVILPQCLRESSGASPHNPRTGPVLSDSLFRFLVPDYVSSSRFLPLNLTPCWNCPQSISGERRWKFRVAEAHPEEAIMDYSCWRLERGWFSCPALFLLKRETKCSMSSDELSAQALQVRE